MPGTTSVGHGGAIFAQQSAAGRFQAGAVISRSGWWLAYQSLSSGSARCVQSLLPPANGQSPGEKLPANDGFVPIHRGSGSVRPQCHPWQPRPRSPRGPLLQSGYRGGSQQDDRSGWPCPRPLHQAETKAWSLGSRRSIRGSSTNPRGRRVRGGARRRPRSTCAREVK